MNLLAQATQPSSQWRLHLSTTAKLPSFGCEHSYPSHKITGTLCRLASPLVIKLDELAEGRIICPITGAAHRSSSWRGAHHGGVHDPEKKISECVIFLPLDELIDQIRRDTYASLSSTANEDKK